MSSETYEFTYMKCQSCSAKIHCDACGEEVRQDLERFAELVVEQIDMKGKNITISSDAMLEDDILDEMERWGLFV